MPTRNHKYHMKPRKVSDKIVRKRYVGNCEMYYDEAGMRHRPDGPATISPGRISYWWHGERHRTDGPAVMYLRNTSTHNAGHVEFWLNGEMLDELVWWIKVGEINNG